jgi:hypothetical protein
MKCLLAFALAFFMSLSGFSQRGYVSCKVPLHDSLNPAFSGEDNTLPEVLIHGYLKGEIKGYRDVVSQPPATSDYPPVWSADSTYEHFERVTFKGKFYFLSKDFSKNEAPGSAAGPWMDLDVTEIKGSKTSFPGTSDLLPVGEFERRLTLYEKKATPWNATTLYKIGDFVSHDSVLFEALADVKGVQPEYGSFDWFVSSGKKTIVPDEIDLIEVIEYYEARGGDTTFYPQMVGLRGRVDPVVSKPIVAFYFGDVLNYLESQERQPLAVEFRNASIGWVEKDLFTNDKHAAENLYKSIIAMIRSGKIARSEIRINDQSLVDELLPGGNWRDHLAHRAFVQYRNSRAEAISLVEKPSYKGPFATIPFQTFSKFLATEIKADPSVSIRSYASALMNRQYVVTEKRPVSISSPMEKKKRATKKITQAEFLIEQYTMLGDREMAKIFSQDGHEIYSLLLQAVENGQLKLFESFNTKSKTCEMPIAFTGRTDTLEVYDPIDPSIMIGWEVSNRLFDQFRVVYQVRFDVSTFTPSFVPVALSLAYYNFTSDYYFPIGYCPFADVERVLAADGEAGLKMIDYLKRNELSQTQCFVMRSFTTSGK